MTTTTAVLPEVSLLRRTGAVFAGLFATFLVTTGVDVALHATGVFHERMAGGLFVLALAYRLVFNVGGAYLTARLAPDRPLHHALALGGVGLALSIAGAILFWDAGPHWYPLAVAATALPCALAGGKAATR